MAKNRVNVSGGRKAKPKSIAPWIDDLCERQMAPIRHLKVTSETLDTVKTAFPLLYHNHFARFILRSGKLSCPTVTDAFPEYIQNRFAIVRKYIELLAPNLPNLQFEIYLGDGFSGWRNSAEVPIFMFSSHRLMDRNTLLLPDPFTISDSSAMRSQVAAGNRSYSWADKIEVAFWRGGTTGEWLTTKDCERNLRFRLLGLSETFPEEIDAGFTTVHETCEPALAQLAQQRNYMKSWTSICDHMHYKYLVLLDGFTSPWARDFWSLHSNSVVLRQMSDFQSWFYPLMKENVHYLPVAGDLSDLHTCVLKARQNDKTAKRISQNARDFAASVLTDDSILGYTKELLVRYAELC